MSGYVNGYTPVFNDMDAVYICIYILRMVPDGTYSSTEIETPASVCLSACGYLCLTAWATVKYVVDEHIALCAEVVFAVLALITIKWAHSFTYVCRQSSLER